MLRIQNSTKRLASIEVRLARTNFLISCTQDSDEILYLRGQLPLPIFYTLQPIRSVSIRIELAIKLYGT